MSEVIDCSAYFEMKQNFNRILREGRNVITRGLPECRVRAPVYSLNDWKKQKRPPSDK